MRTVHKLTVCQLRGLWLLRLAGCQTTNPLQMGWLDRMSKIIEYAISHARLTVAVLIFVLTAGFVAYALGLRKNVRVEEAHEVREPVVVTVVRRRG